VFAVFEKYRWGRTWNRQVKERNTLTPTQYANARKTFKEAIRNGSKIMQVDLNRYHVLCSDLVAPINAKYQIRRKSANKQPKKVPAGAFDVLILAMSIWLQEQHGKDSFVVATGDSRLADVAARAKSESLAGVLRGHLKGIAESLGFEYEPGLYPEVVNLVHCKKGELDNHFPDWQPRW